MAATLESKCLALGLGVQVGVLFKEESTYERRSARPRRAVRFSPRIFLTFL